MLPAPHFWATVGMQDSASGGHLQVGCMQHHCRSCHLPLPFTVHTYLAAITISVLYTKGACSCTCSGLLPHLQALVFHSLPACRPVSGGADNLEGCFLLPAFSPAGTTGGLPTWQQTLGDGSCTGYVHLGFCLPAISAPFTTTGFLPL